jgi:hypothetical protein
MKKAFLLFSVDFETLSLNVHNCPILSLGAFPFYFAEIEEKEFCNVTVKEMPYWDLQKMTYYSVPNYTTQNRVASESTLKWWKEQSLLSMAVINESLNSDITLKDTVCTFNNWITSCCEKVKQEYNVDVEVKPVILGNGAAFDNAILNQIYLEYNIKPAYSYKHSLCARTLFGMLNSKRLKEYDAHYINQTKDILNVTEENFHNALFDAVYQGIKLTNQGWTFINLLVENLD